MIPQAELDELCARHPVDRVAGKWVSLRRHGKGLIGPCPIHSPDPKAADSTAFEIKPDGKWVCVTCMDGGDVIKLVQRREGISFLEAVKWLGGTQQLDPARAAELNHSREAKLAKREREANQFRDRERQTLWDIWQRAAHWVGTPAEQYLIKRGLTPPPALRLRCVEDMPYFVDRGAGKKIVVHRGPAMLAPVLRPDGHFGGVHFTYLDLTTQKGKIALTDPASGKVLDAKKSRGSIAGGFIDLFPLKRVAPTDMVIGEGIEKVLAVHQALAAEPAIERLDSTVFRTSISLGNIGGRSAGAVVHPGLTDAAGRARRVPGPIADMAAPGIPVEPSIARAIVLGDSTSDRFNTECSIARAAQRWSMGEHHGVPVVAGARRVLVAWAPDGFDFDDLLRVA